MNIGIRLHDTIDGTVEERLNYIGEQGFTCAHIALGKLGLKNDILDLTPDYATWLKEKFSSHGIEIAVLGNYQNLAHPVEATLLEIERKYKANLQFARTLGCTVVGTETGAPNADYHYEAACHTRDALNIFLHNLEPIVEYAEMNGTYLAIEPVYKHIVWNPKVAREVLDSIRSKHLRIIFDPVNLLHPDNLDQRDKVIGDAMELLSDEITVIHLKDYKSDGKELNCMGCGLGDMDYRAILQFIQTEKPDIQVTLENTKPENAAQCREFLLSQI